MASLLLFIIPFLVVCFFISLICFLIDVFDKNKEWKWFSVKIIPSVLFFALLVLFAFLLIKKGAAFMPFN